MLSINSGYKKPKDLPFLWGAATAGHQVEGNNIHSDIYALEHVTPSVFKEKSNLACNNYELWETDLDLVKQLGLNCYRFSIEWSRIEPQPNQYSKEAIQHYVDLISGCYERGLFPVVTLCHFSCPAWFSAQGGWTTPKASELFARYCKKIAAHIATQVPYLITFNEPNILEVLDSIGLPKQIWTLQNDMLKAAATQFGSDKFSCINAMNKEDFDRSTTHLIEGHQIARDIFHSYNPDMQIGFSIAIVDDQAQGSSRMRDRIREKNYGRWLSVADQCDFIGIQNYEKMVWDEQGTITPPPQSLRNFSGAWVDATSLRHCIEYVYEETGKPLMVTEHGLGTDNDELRHSFLQNTLRDLDSLPPNIPLLGYIHWTLIDNFEWVAGFSAHFGLFKFDQNTFVRTPKASAFAFKEWVKSHTKANLTV